MGAPTRRPARRGPTPSPSGPVPLISSRSQLTKAAQLYYIAGISQPEIARRMQVSIASVSRALTKARQLGIVEIQIHGDPDDFYDLEIALEQAYGLRECRLVAAFDQVEHTYAGMARALADLLGRILKRGDTLGLSWGETLKAVVAQMPRLSVRDVNVVPITGAMGTIDTGIYPSSLARTFAEKVGGTPYLINTPAIVESKVLRRSLMSDGSFRQVRGMWKKLGVVLLGGSGIGKESSMYRANLVSAGELESLASAGGVAATNFSIFDERGQPVASQVSDRIVKLPLEDLKRVTHSVLIAAGKNKVNALRAILRSKVVNTLITDAESARALLPGSDPSKAADGARP
jgi:DNA-binding transcriptional regulator LsrR (DeoR family)